MLGLSFPNEQDAAFAAVSRFTALSREELEGVRRGRGRARQGCVLVEPRGANG
jgi:hypothetical protein